MDIGKYFAWALFLALVGAAGSFADRNPTEGPALEAPSSNPRSGQMVAAPAMQPASPKMQPVSVEASGAKMGTGVIR